jgi:hypothetical protein
MNIKEHRWRGGKGRTKFCYTYQEIADKKGVKIDTVYRAVKKGILDPNNIFSVCEYITGCKIIIEE